MTRTCVNGRAGLLAICCMLLLAAHAPRTVADPSPGGYPDASPTTRTQKTSAQPMQSIALEQAISSYRQTVSLSLATPDQATAAQISIEPLYDGYPRAVTARWDDNLWEDATAVQQAMNARGVKGTWYLNGNAVHYLKGRDHHPQGRALLEGGHTIGGHSLTHPWLTCVRRNVAFEEMAAVRIEWEAALDLPVLSWSFPYIDYRDPFDGAATHAALLRMLMRAGYYHVAEFANFADEQPSALVYSVIMPPENATLEEFQKAVAWAIGDARLARTMPAISHSMHPWYNGVNVHYQIDELERRLDHLAQYDYWQCNQNQYAAYWLQSQRTRIVEDRAEGATRRLTLERPALRFLNDPIPLTLAVRGLPGGAAAALHDERGEIIASGSGPRAGEPAVLRWHVPHGPGQFLPTRIEHLDCTTQTAPVASVKFPGLSARLQLVQGYKLALALENHSTQTLSSATLVVRVPLAFAAVPEEVAVPTLAPGGKHVIKLPLRRLAGDPRDSLGTFYFAVQLDFTLGDQPGRVHLTTHTPAELKRDDAFPSGNLAVLGPLDPATFNKQVFAGQVAAGNIPASLPGANGIETWRVGATPGPIPQQQLSDEIVRTSGDWRQLTSPLYVVRGTLESPDARPVRLLVHPTATPLLMLNGQALTNGEGQLHAGANDLVLIHHIPNVTGSGWHVGCFLRAVDPETNERMRDIRYLPPTPVQTEGATELQQN